MATHPETTEWDRFVEKQKSVDIDLLAEAKANFHELMTALLRHHQNALSPIWMATGIGDRYFENNEQDPVAEANYNYGLAIALKDLAMYSVGTSKRIDMVLAVFSLYKELEAELNEESRPAFIATRGMLDTEIEDAVSRIHNYREKLANCIELRSKCPLGITRKPNSQGVGFGEVYRAARGLKQETYLKRVLNQKFNNSSVKRLLVLRHGVTHGISPALERPHGLPRLVLDDHGVPQEIQSKPDISYDEAISLVTKVWRELILGTEQLFKNEWL